MNKPLTDIELIRKYHLKQLDGKTMQQLEQRALDDPFFADALEGFEEFPLGETEIHELNAALDQKINNLKRKKGFIIVYRSWAVAASVIIFIGLLTVFINQKKDNEVLKNKPQIAQLPHADTTKTRLDSGNPVTKEEGKLKIIEESPVVVNNSNKAKEVLTKQNISESALQALANRTDTVSLNEVVVIGYPTQQKTALTGAVVSKSSKVAALVNTDTQSSPEVRIRGLSVPIVTGRVMDETGQALPGVIIVNEQNNAKVTTNANGEFSIEALQGSSLTLNYLGFNKEQVKIKDSDSLNIILKEDKNALSEVVVVGYGFTKKANTEKNFQNFKEYIKGHNKLPNGEEGTVVVEFYITKDGIPSDFKIRRSLSKQADKRALELIKIYPSWQKPLDVKSEKMVVKIRFE